MADQESYTVKHALCDFKITPSDALSLRIETEKITVNGVDVRGHIWLFDEGKGFTTKYDHTWLRRRTGSLGSVPSKTWARVLDIMVQVGLAFIEKHPDRMHKAAMVAFQNAIDELDSKVNEHHVAIKKLDAERASLAALRLNMAERSFAQVHAAAVAKAKEEQEREKKKRGW